jgi:hypothetical protein
MQRSLEFRARGFESVLSLAVLFSAKMQKAIFTGANLSWAKVNHAIVREADFTASNLSSADFSESDLSEATICNADLSNAVFVRTRLQGTILADCRVFGVSAWGLDLSTLRRQQNLCITPPKEPAVIVDNLEVAQFLYLMIHNKGVSRAIETIGKKGVLILGRFIPERKVVLDAIRDRLRHLGFVPMMFDFERVRPLDFTETIQTLAGLSLFIIADITDSKSAPFELKALVPDYMVPLIPILKTGEEPFSMFQDLQNKYGKEGEGWVLDVLRYEDADSLVRRLKSAVINPAIERANKLLARKLKKIRERRVEDYEEDIE